MTSASNTVISEPRFTHCRLAGAFTASKAEARTHNGKAEVPRAKILSNSVVIVVCVVVADDDDAESLAVPSLSRLLDSFLSLSFSLFSSSRAKSDVNVVVVVT